MTGLQRRHAKDCNFAKSYGAGIAKFAAMTGKTETEAADIMGTYDRELPFVRQLSQYATKLADRRGYIVMFDGARAHFDKWEVAYLKREEWQRGIEEGHRMDACSMEEAKKRQDTIGHPWRGERLKRAFTHKALNRRIQGNAARQMKLAMAQCWDEGLVPLLQLHDELAFSLPVTEQGKKDGDRIVEIMKTAYQCSVPFLVDAEWGRTWGDAKHSGTEFFVHESRGAGERRRGKGVRAAGR